MPDQIEPVKTKLPGFTIRHAEEKDVPLILEFIRQLAIYEKLLNEVVATEEDFRRCLFGKKRYAETVIGYEGDVPVGYALFFNSFSTFLGKPGIYLEDLFVNPEYRGKGYGKALLTYLARLAVERNCGRLEWAVLDWNEPSIKFYESLGAKLMKEWIINRVDGTSLEELAEQF
ncbi:MAG: GNAT family N-acetyltransferase [Bacteroidales bacterium]|nr:GNAT family N-acetyltransferase [Bacteroidales bacterium]